MLSAISEIQISPTEFQLFARLVLSVSGIMLGEQKKGLLMLRLGKRMRATGDRSFISYYRRVRRDEQELAKMIDAVTTNVTCFFREAHHFEFLLQELPALVKQEEVRIWSAGCASGEEPYSIAATVVEAFRGRPDLAGRVKILATDLCGTALAAAQAGAYRLEDVQGAMDREMLSRCFLKGQGSRKGTVQVKEELHGMVRFAKLNLLADAYPFRRQFHFIFCRNVMIYFDNGTRQKLLSRFHRHLLPGGHLFLGHSETVINNGEFEPVAVTTYRKNGA